jgi:3-methyladenine DNA glycosylase AlkD
MTVATAATQSPITAASNRFVAAHLEQASALGARLAELVANPDAFVQAMREGLGEIADVAYIDGVHSVTPGLGPVLGVRLPLLEAAHKQFRRATKQTPPLLILAVTDRLLMDDAADIRWFGMWNLERLLATHPEQTWELMRCAAREASEWISVDTLAHPYADGILREPRRWSDLQLLVHSPSRWERRLVGSTIAALPHVRRASAKDKGVASRGLMLIGLLIGDADPDVQKSLSWALRSLAPIDPAAVSAFVEREAATARTTDDGHRAWVLRDALPKLPPETQETLRASLAGVRRRPGVSSTSRAATSAVESASARAAKRPAHKPGRNSAP